MTQEQKDLIENAADVVHRAFDTLEKAELELRNLGDIKADDADPYSYTPNYAADKIADARDSLEIADEALRQLRDAKVEEDAE